MTRSFALAAAVALVAISLPATAQQRVGVAGAVVPDASMIATDGATRTLQIGSDVAFRERVRTGPAGQTQLLFLDQSALTVGPNAELAIDEFVYDPATGTGRIAVNAAAGVFRYVGGKISKNSDVTIRTPSLTIGVRGGIAYVEVDPDGTTRATLGFGRALTITAINGTFRQVITTPGFGITAGPATRVAPQPQRVDPGSLGRLMAQNEGRAPAPGAGNITSEAVSSQSASSSASAAPASLPTPAAAPRAVLLPNVDADVLTTATNQSLRNQLNNSRGTSQPPPVAPLPPTRP